MSLTNPNTPVSQQDLQDFYHKILPYMGGSSGGGGHTIEDAEGTDLTQRDTLQFTDSFDVSDDSTNEKTVVDLKSLDTGDIDTIVYPLPTEYHPDTKCGYTPVGTIIAYFGNTPPLHYLACDGSGYMAADYPELAQYMWDNFPTSAYSGDGTTTFEVPDLRGEFLRGTGTNSHTGNGSGSAVGTHQDATSLPYYRSNAATVDIMNSTTSSASVSISNQDSTKQIQTGTPQWSRANRDSTATTGLTGDSFTTRPTNTSVLWCIATKDIYIDARYDYSTNEKVVGTYIDGSSLYQRTYITTLPDTANTEKKISHGISNLKAIVSHEACVLSSNGKSITCLPWISTAGAILASIVRLDGDYIGLASNSDRSANTAIITIRYIKTTS